MGAGRITIISTHGGNMRSANLRQTRAFPGTACALAIALATMFPAIPAEAQAAQVKAQPAAAFEELEGKLADGTLYVLRKPANWNGIVLRNLDGHMLKDSPAHLLFLSAGYGLAGVTRRPPDREWTLNRLDDVRRPQQAVELFRARFGEPRFVIAFGTSAGGASALLTAERHADRVDGAVALCPTVDIVGYAGYNMIFDFLYVLKNLLAPNDERLRTHAVPTWNTKPDVDYFSSIVREAIKTPEGRARIALAITLTQYPAFGSPRNGPGVRKPDFDDPIAAANAMSQSATQIVERLALLSVHGEKDFPPDLEIPGTPVSNPVGNDGAVYADYWKHADSRYRRATEIIYARANLNLAADLRAIDASPRVGLDRDNLRRGVLARGVPGIPVFRVENLGDQTAPPSLSKLYDMLIAFNGLNGLYRTAHVDNSGHCYFKPSQSLAAINVMRERLETGSWPSTDAAALNARAGANDGDGVIFVDAGPTSHPPFWRLNRSTDLFQRATFANTSMLVNEYQYSVTEDQKKQLLAALASAATPAGDRKAERDAALDRFVALVNDIRNPAVRTRLRVAVYQLRMQDEKLPVP